MKTHGPFTLLGTAGTLYDGAAKDASIYDYHCHLSPREIYEDSVLPDIAEAMLGHDHYKWRAMRYMGIPEDLVTGKAASLDKFTAWMGVCEKLIGSPLRAWTKLELSAFFKVHDEPCRRNARAIFEQCNSLIREQSLSPRKIIADMRVKVVCTTDDPVDDLRHHRLLAGDEAFSCRVLPTFRPDAAFKTNSGDAFGKYVARLEEASGQKASGYAGFLSALRERLDFFRHNGCLFADHSLECLDLESADAAEVEEIFSLLRGGGGPTKSQAAKYRFALLRDLGRLYAERGMVMQLHVGALRNVNRNAFARLGADAGYDVPNDFSVAEALAFLLDAIESSGGLPRTILYSLNQKDYPALAALCPAFTQEGLAGKVQLGPAWWHCDTEQGMREQIACSAAYGILAAGFGMLTDSRSFLSFVRHDYYRRILCCYLGDLCDSGSFCGDHGTLADIVRGLCGGNVAGFLNSSHT